LGVTTDPQDGDENGLYDFTIEYAAVIDRIAREKFTENELAEIVATMTFPFLREAVANITSRGRFGPVWLNPFNVHEAIERADMQRNAAAEATKETSPTS
jgi:preprotein translocase subunit SecB